MHLLKKMSLLFIVLSLFAIFSIPDCSCQDQQYMDCVGANHCAGMRFAYPFWVGDVQNTSCGYPGFQVSCQASIPRVTIGELTYRVLSSVYSSNRTLTVAREDLWDDVCPPILKNTALDASSMFSFTNSTKNLTLSYGCTSSAAPSTLKPENQFDCSVNGTTSSSFFTTSDSTIPPTFKCNSSIFVAVHQSAAQNLTGVGALRSALAAGFTLQYRVNSTFCERCIDTGGRCGFNTSSTMMACYCADGAHDLVCHGSSRSTTKLSRVAVVLIVTTVVLVSLVSIVVIGYLAKRCSWWKAIIYWKSEKGSNQLVQEYMRNYGSIAPKLYTYSEIKKMTNSFGNKLGHGGYGLVFKGKLPDGRLVAVKVLNDDSGSGEDFINEVGTISRTSHVNVVALLGFCYNRSKRALVYEFMPNGSLDKFLIKKKGSLQDVTKADLLDWKLLYEIAVGIARGLEYLHRGCSIRVVHFDIKPQNILLDADFCPKISDFGLAKLCQKKDSIMSSLPSPRGTIGYMAPEVFCRNFGGVSHKSDVYSYGMMVLEMVGLRSKLEIDSQQTSESYFPSWIYKHCELSKCLSKSAISEEEETVMKMGIVGLWCIQTNPGDRPSISKVLEMIESSTESLQIPPKPFIDDPIGMDSHQDSWMSNITND